ncbi:hypothetical protein PGTUg99_033934 [Puccinia graminis f. sp. tritici]|uniref:Uncharacterized protein n=1 Tax=Puccinia graminis f. sp. tritici TaxID=56615 RepID=A0A5B0P276_PUCGR|nr:hypothetical protein PGTUg99_033934 [Puccinia graminis f. sp. tritici]
MDIGLFESSNTVGCWYPSSRVIHAYTVESPLEMGASNPDIRADADIRSRFQRKHTSASASASASGYPRIPAL